VPAQLMAAISSGTPSVMLVTGRCWRSPSRASGCRRARIAGATGRGIARAR
jgi:hypothetical protein